MQVAQRLRFQSSNMLANHKVIVSVKKIPGFINRVLGRKTITFVLDGKEILRNEVRNEEWSSKLDIVHQIDPAKKMLDGMMNILLDSANMDMPPMFYRIPNDIGKPVSVAPQEPKHIVFKPMEAKTEYPEKPKKSVIVKMGAIRKGDCLRCGSKKSELKGLPCIVYGRMFKNHLIKK